MSAFKNKKDFLDFAEYLFNNTQNIELGSCGEIDGQSIISFNFKCSNVEQLLNSIKKDEWQPEVVLENIKKNILEQYENTVVTYDYWSEDNCYRLEIDNDSLTYEQFHELREKYSKQSFYLCFTWKQYLSKWRKR